MLRAAAIPVLVVTAAAQTLAPYWTAAPSTTYQAGIDRKVARTGRSSLFLKAAAGDPQGYSARQRIRADAFRGKKIRLSGWIKTDQAPSGGALWVRIDMQNGDYILDSMLDLAGRDWTRVQIVAPVPADAAGISFGLRMKGSGQVWADGLTLEVAAPGTATTTIERRKDPSAQHNTGEYSRAPLRPGNLDFEQ